MPSDGNVNFERDFWNFVWGISDNFKQMDAYLLVHVHLFDRISETLGFLIEPFFTLTKGLKYSSFASTSVPALSLIQ